MKKLVFLFLLLLPLLAEDTTVKIDKVASSVASSTEFNPQASSVFTFLGIAPASIQRPTLLRDLKFEGGLSADAKLSIGFELQPIWILGFRNVSFNTYDKIPGFIRNLINTSFSIGIKQDKLTSLGYAVRIPIFYKDPMADKEYIKNLTFEMTDVEEALMEEIQDIDLKLVIGSLGSSMKEELLRKRNILNNKLENKDAEIKARAIAYKEAYQASNWNAAQMNLTFAQGMDADTNDPISIVKNYFAVFLTANQPITKNGILSEMFKLYYQEGTSTNLYFQSGLNLTIGNSKVNGFLEAIVQSTTNDILNSFNLNIGGYFRPTEKLTFDLGLKFGFDKKSKLINIGPALNGNFKI